MRSLSEFTADLLTETGAIVEPTDDGLEVLLPPQVAGALEIPEHANLSFSSGGEKGIPVSYDSETFKKMARLFGSQGRFSTVSLPTFPVKLEKLEQRLDEKLILNNAVFHLERKEEKKISYLLACFKYTALSDDRQEGIGASLINEFNFAPRRIDPLDVIAINFEELSEGAECQTPDRVLSALWRAQREIVKEALHDFVTITHTMRASSPALTM